MVLDCAMLGTIARLAILCAVAPATLAQSGKVTRLVVAFPPGGPVDFVARVLAEPLSRELGRAVVVENRAGANGAIGAELVARSIADGSVLFFTSMGAMAINPSLYPRLPYDPRGDFAPVSQVANNATVFVVNRNNPAANVTDFIASSNLAARPVPIGSSGIGSNSHLTLELFEVASRARLLHVPYKGAAPAITDVISGQIVGFMGDLSGLIGNIRGERLRPIGIAAAKRHPLLPELRTFAEQGISGADSNNWYAVFAPAKTEAYTVALLNRGIGAALRVDAVREKLLQSGAEPAHSSPEELAAVMARDTAKWARIIREKNIAAE